MSPNDWYLTEDVGDLLARATDFLHSRPDLHTVPLTVTEALRTHGAAVYGSAAPAFGLLERAGEVRAVFFRTPPHHLVLTPLTPEEADGLAARLAHLGHPLPGVDGDRDTAAVFAEAWQRHTGAIPTLSERKRLYRLGGLTPPEPSPPGRARIADEEDRERLVLWHRGFVADVGGTSAADGESWADTRIAAGRVTLWETPDGTPVSMAGVSPLVAGQIRIAPVYTPAHLRGRGYGGAATAAASRAALGAGAAQVLLFTDLANATSNALYQRIGYRPVADFAVYDFASGTPAAG
ncbi:putative GNAT family acetyltransferase [Streptomyces sp. BK208]|uniref:GNAT family N-acetyltransferase n=1 Tax=Streptomyces sp. BK208 TaxID=2512150 RepID=UPI001060F153|nr:GNAT family N-acetyltransferase [Streptomyces sp. BK208]TDT38004.1 putative GNAT family acetyltransferase [Streptomyces sp. BK208]